MTGNSIKLVHIPATSSSGMPLPYGMANTWTGGTLAGSKQVILYETAPDTIKHLKEWLFYALSNADSDHKEIEELVEKTIIIKESANGFELVENEGKKELFMKALKSLKLELGDSVKITLPDESILELLPNGSYKIIDEHCEVRYKANRRREYNKYMESSDMVEAFLKFLKSNDVSKDSALNYTIQDYIKWLIVQSAKEDDELESLGFDEKDILHENDRNRYFHLTNDTE